MFQSKSQIDGTKAHEKIDNGQYSSQKSIITAIDVYSEKYGVLYHYPLTNVYEDGRICWGDLKIPACMSVSDISSFFFNPIVKFWFWIEKEEK